MFEAALNRFGAVDVLVNNAGMVQEATVEIKDMTLEYYETMVRNNTSSMFLMCREMVRHVLARGYGGAHIINVLSKASISSTSPGQTHYVTSKAGGMGFTKSLAAEVTKYGIHVNGICRGSSKINSRRPRKSATPKLMQSGWRSSTGVRPSAALQCRSTWGTCAPCSLRKNPPSALAQWSI